jgi:hypothetical protein
VSRKWPGETLADHRADRKNSLLATLGQTELDPARYSWEPVSPAPPTTWSTPRPLLHVVADRQRWQASHTVGGRGDPRYQRAIPAAVDRRTAD